VLLDGTLPVFAMRIDQNNIDTAMHFAAQTRVDNSFGNFQPTSNDVTGTRSRRQPRTLVTRTDFLPPASF